MIKTSFKKTSVNFFLILFILVSNHCFSQVSGQLYGYVYDEKTNEPLIGATILLEGTNFGTITDFDGNFEFDNVQPKTYNILISFLGYKSKKLFNVIIKSKGTPVEKIYLSQLKETLDEVVITQNPFYKSKESPLSIQTFSAVEIQSYPGGNNDITKVVQSMPGISPSIGGFRNDIIIRGGAPNESVYYLDDIEIPNINHFSTQGSSGGPVGLVNISFISEVTLSTSSFESEYDNPLSGVLKFKQREGNSKEFRGNFRLGASEAGITLEGPLFKNSSKDSKTTMIFSARRSYLKYLFKLIGLAIRPDYWDYQWKINHIIDPYNSISVLGIGSIDDFSSEAPEDFNSEQQIQIDQAPVIDQTTNTWGVTWKRKFKNSPGSLVSSVSSNRLNNLISSYTDNLNEQGVIFQNDSHEWETKLKVKLTSYYKDWKIKLGANIQFADYLNDTQDYINNINYFTTINFYKYGIYSNISKSFLDDNLDFSFGFRLDADTFSTGSDLLDNFSPRLGLSYALFDDNRWKLNMTYGEYYKMPTYTMLGFQNNNGEFSNKNSKYTKSVHHVIGLDYNSSSSSKFSLEYFVKNYSQYPISIIDGISMANKGGDFEVFGNEDIVTSGKGKSSGIEFLFQQKLSNNFYGIFSYTNFKSEFTDINSNYIPSVWDSKHLISFTGGYKLKKNWEVSARWRFSGKTPYVPYDLSSSVETYPEMIFDYSRLGEVKLSNFSLADIRFDKKWNYEKYSFNFYLDIQNFLGQKIPIPPKYGLQRNEQFEVIIPRNLVEVGITNGSVIPSFGFTVDF